MKKLILKTCSLITLLTASAACFSTPESASSVPYKEAEFHRITHAGSIPVPDGQLKPQISRLIAKAEGGDALAAASLYAALGGCSTLYLSKNDAEFKAHCDGVTNEDVHDQGRWLTLAARLGNKAAQYNYAAVGVDVMFGNPVNAIKNPDGVKRYREQAQQYLKELSNQCQIDAMSLIIRDASRDGLIYGANPELAYKFMVVLNTISTTPDLSAEHELETKIDPQHVFSLRADATSFIDSQCK